MTRSLDEARAYGKHVWRDTPPLNDDGTVNGYVEISRGDRRKWEFRIGMNKRAIDRMLALALRRGVRTLIATEDSAPARDHCN